MASNGLEAFITSWLTPLQCDESHPQCKRCVDYGVTCNYDGDAKDELQLPGEGAFSFTSKPDHFAPDPVPWVPKDSLSPESNDYKIDNMLGSPMELHETDEVYHMTKEDIDTLRMFKDQTVFTIGTAQTTHVYRAELVNLICCSVSGLVTSLCFGCSMLIDRPESIIHDACRLDTNSDARPI